MGKRDTGTVFEKRSRDYYPTIDPSAALPLRKFIYPTEKVLEPCAGNGDLANLLLEYEVCKTVYMCDIEPQNDSVVKMDALYITKSICYDLDIDYIVTNPPFSWNLLKPLLDHLPYVAPTWLLLPADVMHNKRMVPYMEICSDIVSVGRLYWMENKVKGVDNFCWYLFNSASKDDYTVFHCRD